MVLLQPPVPVIGRPEPENVKTVVGAHARKTTSGERRSGRDAGDGERETHRHRGAEAHARDDHLHLTEGGEPVTLLLKRIHRTEDRQQGRGS